MDNFASFDYIVDNSDESPTTYQVYFGSREPKNFAGTIDTTVDLSFVCYARGGEFVGVVDHLPCALQLLNDCAEWYGELNRE